VLTITAQLGFREEFLEFFREVSAVDGSACGRALRHAERIVIEDVEIDPDFAEYRSIARASGFRSVQSTPLIGRDGNPLGMISTHWPDVHRPDEIELLALNLCARQICDFVERCRADELLREKERASRRLAAIVESSDDAIVSKNLSGIITSWNAGAERLFGYVAEEVLGQSITMLIPPDRQDEEPHILDRIRRGEKIEHYETTRRRKDGTLIDVSLTVSPVKDRHGKIVGASKIARDISEKRLAEKQRELLVAELSHRVKNTLATVMSVARHSFRPGTTLDEAREAFEKRLQALANNHNRLADAFWSGVALNDIVADELSPYRNKAGSNVSISGPRVIVKARHALSLGMAIHELATNAAKYGALSTDGGTVSAEWEFDSERDELHILWTEIGGPPTRAPDKQGFGRLLLERALATDLGGDVQLDFDSSGLKCAISIPLTGPVVERSVGSESAREDLQPTAPRLRHLASSLERDRSQFRVLVVEDEFLLASMLTDDLSSAGFTVVGPFTALEPALSGSQEEQIDLAILDVNLGQEKVYPLADQLVERKLPFILLTGYGTNDLPERFRRSPRVAKPYDASTLLRAIEDLPFRQQLVN
jgi:PAS domain S-box-containing protein